MHDQLLPKWEELCSVAQQPNLGLGSLMFEVSRSHTHTIRHTLGRTPQNEWSACRRGRCLHSKEKRRTSMPSAGLEPVIPAIKQPQTYALDHTATGIGVTHTHTRARASVSIYLLPTYLPVCLSIYLSIYLCIYLPVCLCVCLSVYLSVSIYLSICLSLSIYLFICLSVGRSAYHCSSS